MADRRTPSRWPYRAAPPARGRRVVRRRADDAPRGVHRREPAPPVWRITPRQARLMLAGALLAVLAYGAWWLYHSPYLTVHEIEVEGAVRISEQDVVDAAGIDGARALTLDLTAAEARVAAALPVRSVDIERHGFTGATIRVEERTVWGSWQVNGVNIPIDAEGYVLDAQLAPEGAPVIIDAEPAGVINPGDRLDAGAVELAARIVEEADTAFGRDVLALVYRRSAGLTVVLSAPDIEGKPVWVTFGDSRDYDYKVAALYVLLEQARERRLSISAIDLRFGERLSFN